MAVVYEHTAFLHNERLQSLCRVCGGRSSKKTKPRAPILCQYVTSELREFFEIDISCDSPDIHSSTLCSKCYARLRKLKMLSVPSKTILKTSLSDVEKAAPMWVNFDAALSVHQCSVCSVFVSQSKGGRPAKRKRSSQQAQQSSSIDGHDMDMESDDNNSTFLPTPRKSSFHGPVGATQASFSDMQTSPIAQKSNTTDTCIQTTPQKAKSVVQTVDSTTSPIVKSVVRHVSELSGPLSRDEEQYLTALTCIKIAESDDKSTARLKTKGQPIIMRKVVKPRKPSVVAGLALKKKRARQVDRFRLGVSGSLPDDTVQQQAAELKKTTKTYQQRVLHAAGFNKPSVTAKQGLAWRTGLGLSWSKQRKQRQFVRSLGIKLESEKAERRLQRKIMCSDIKIQHMRLESADSPSQDSMPVGLCGSDDLPAFVRNILDQCDQENLLTWHDDSIPENEVWVKIGGDHGGGSFKLMLQVANVKEPNSKQNTILLELANCKDNHNNLKKLLRPYKRQVANLQQAEWKGKQIRVFLFGDYEFLTKIYGLSGAQSLHPCLWCTTSKRYLQKSQAEQSVASKRSLKSIKRDRRRFRIHGGNDKKKAKSFNNVIHTPLFDVPLSQVAPPYLHILLGVGKKHHDLLEEDCHRLDKHIAACLAEDREKIYENMSPFGKYVNNMQKLKAGIIDKERELDRLGTELAFYDLSAQTGEGDAALFDRRQKEEEYNELLQDIEEEEEECRRQPLAFRLGPVTSNLDIALRENKITVQAYHGRSFVGNHCHKYLQPSVTENICQSVAHITDTLTSDTTIKKQAVDIGKKYYRLNSLYHCIHRKISHTKPVTEVDIKETEQYISDYMAYFRQHFPKTKIIPKQHILEHHCLEFMKTWHFGLGLHGEQSGEETHAFVNELKVRVRGVNRAEDKVRVLLKEHMTVVSPLLRAAMPFNAPTKGTKK